MFPYCEVWAMAVFGSLHDMPAYVADPLAAAAEIAFNAGNQSELIRTAYQDYERLAGLTVAKIYS